jgi:hypothetical protein
MDPRNFAAFLRHASQALQAAHGNPPDHYYDLQVQNSVTALVNRLQIANAQAIDARDQCIPLRNVASQYAFEILCQECTTVDSASRFEMFLPIFLDALDALAEFAYSPQGVVNLLSHTQSLERSASSLTLSPATHKSSAFGVLQGGEGVTQPPFSGSDAVQQLATRLHNLALETEGGNFFSLDDLIVKVSHHLINFFEARSGLVCGVPHGIIGNDIHTPARDLQELFRFAHSDSQWYSGHLARAHLLKLARYLFKLFTGLDKSTNTEIEEDIQVCSPAMRILCAMHGYLFLDFMFCCSSAHHLQCNGSYDPKFLLPPR